MWQVCPPRPALWSWRAKCVACYKQFHPVFVSHFQVGILVVSWSPWSCTFASSQFQSIVMICSFFLEFFGFPSVTNIYIHIYMTSYPHDMDYLWPSHKSDQMTKWLLRSFLAWMTPLLNFGWWKETLSGFVSVFLFCYILFYLKFLHCRNLFEWRIDKLPTCWPVNKDKKAKAGQTLWTLCPDIWTLACLVSNSSHLSSVS